VSLAALLGLFGLAQAATVDRIAAVVNDDVIALSEVYTLGGPYIDEAVKGGGEKARRGAELEVVESLLQRALITQEMQRLDLDVTEEDMERAIVDIAQRNGLDRDHLRSEVEKSGMMWQDYRDELRENLRQMKFNQAVIQPRIVVKEDELQDAWRRKMAGLNQPMQAELGALFLSAPANGDAAAQAAAEAKVAEVQRRLAAGESFEAVSKALDEGPYGKSDGHMGAFKQGDLMELLDRPAFSVAVGGTSEPIRTPQGFMFLHVFSRKAAEAKGFEEVRDQLMEEVYGGRIEQETEQWFEAARRKAAVQILLEPAAKP